MVGRGIRRGRGTSRPVLGKRGRDQTVEPAEQEGSRGRGRPRGQRSGQHALGSRSTRGTRNPTFEQRGAEVTSTAAQNDEISSRSLTSTTKSTTSNAYQARFREDLISHNVIPLDYHDIDKYPDPDNMKEIRDAMDRDRSWPPNFRQMAEAYRKALRRVMNEPKVVPLLNLTSIPADTTAIADSNVIAIDRQWSKLDPLSACFKPAKPDLAYATAANNLKRPVRDRLGTLIMPPVKKDFICPNFMVAAKGPSGRHNVNDLEAAYVGALAARGMHTLWSFGSSNTEDVGAGINKKRIARTITCTWLAGHFTMYATYRQDQPEAEDRPEGSVSTSSALPTYCTSLVDSWFFNTFDDERLKKAFGAYLNGLEWAKKQRDQAIERANARYEEIYRLEKMSSSNDESRGGYDQHPSVEFQEISDRAEVDDEGSPAHEHSGDDEGSPGDDHSGDDESHNNEDPREGQDLRQLSWSFNSADSQRTITRSRARRIMMATGTSNPEVSL